MDTDRDTINNANVAKVFESYPQAMQKKLMRLRQLILQTATETKTIEQLEETLKWGEPSYLTPGGSTIRIGWKTSSPHQFAMYFHCKTRLVDTFKELYGDLFKYEGNRAIIFNETDRIPVVELKHCISLSLSYHSRKHLPLLGAERNTL